MTLDEKDLEDIIRHIQIARARNSITNGQVANAMQLLRRVWNRNLEIEIEARKAADERLKLAITDAYNPRGIWNLQTARDEPYVYTPEKADTVYHYGRRWQCLKTGTLQEPKWGCTDWFPLEGDFKYYCSLISSQGLLFNYRNMNTTLVASVSYAGQDVFDEMVAHGIQMEWKRETGNEEADKSWKPDFIQDTRNVRILREDMGRGWMSEYRNVTFTFTAYVTEWYEKETLQEAVRFNLNG